MRVILTEPQNSINNNKLENGKNQPGAAFLDYFECVLSSETLGRIHFLFVSMKLV